MPAATMKKTVMVVMMMVMMMMVGTVEGGWRRRHRHQRCHRAPGHGVMEAGAGDHYVWTMSGLDEDDLRVTYHAGAFAPEGRPVVFMYPRDRGQRKLGLVPAKLFYDFSYPQRPVTVIRKAQRGRGVCIVTTRSDVSSYEDMLTRLLERNVTNREVEEEEEAVRLVVEQTANMSSFSELLRDLCSQDLCGNPVDTVYFTAREEDLTEEEEELLVEAEEVGAALDRSFMLFNDRVVISGLPTRRQLRRMNRMRPDESREESREQRRQQRREQKLQRRQEVRQGRRQERRQQRRQERRQRRHQRRELVLED